MPAPRGRTPARVCGRAPMQAQGHRAGPEASPNLSCYPEGLILCVFVISLLSPQKRVLVPFRLGLVTQSHGGDLPAGKVDVAVRATVSVCASCRRTTCGDFTAKRSFQQGACPTAAAASPRLPRAPTAGLACTPQMCLQLFSPAPRLPAAVRSREQPPGTAKTHRRRPCVSYHVCP